MRIAFWSLLLLVCAGLWAANHLRWNNELSEPTGLYMITHDEPIKAGNLIIWAGPMKVVAALPGDTVRFTPEGIYINGKYWPDSAPEKDIPAYPFGEYKVPADTFLGLGRHPDSYDGRYYGFMPLGLITATAEPVWVK